jgi:hypothetical protein
MLNWLRRPRNTGSVALTVVEKVQAGQGDSSSAVVFPLRSASKEYLFFDVDFASSRPGYFRSPISEDWSPEICVILKTNFRYDSQTM